MSAPALIEGVIDGIPDNDYHAMTSHLSCSSARRLLAPSCPALFKYEREHGRPPKDEFDLGHAVHKEVLGVGADVELIDHTTWRTKDSRERRDAAYASGKVPMLREKYEPVKAMAAAVQAHPLAGKLLEQGSGKAEQSMFWIDQESGIPLRSRVDWVRNPVAGSRLILVDLKTSEHANPARFAKSAGDFGYHIQDSWYRMGATALGLDPDPAFLFVIVETRAPHLVSVVQLDRESKQIGEGLGRAAINTYKQCMETGEWPGFTDQQPELVSLPGWIKNQFEEYL